TGMYENKIIQKNLKILKDIGYQILEPEDGFLACGTNGKGRLCDLNKIFDKTIEILNRDNFSNKYFQKKIIVTAGGTIEDIDPVRYISNYSSGKMGLAIADEAFKLGLEPVLITTKYIQRPYKVKEVKSALEMKAAVEQEFQNADYVVMAAAVADYRVKNKSEQKIKKSADDILMLELVKNPDILKALCSDKKHQIIVGFCAESENLENNALEKLKQKGCDFLVANDISRKDIGFNSDYNEVTVFDKFGNSTKLDRAGKNEIAKKILDIILK
ncbi:bifunctional phosphopantothenoylcysteine decarboxylase/phosphopantothenate--cysteine ligase CoaBC, partial [bacterium]|nr:bifunctional phosphopantothenoylcysteine decarboxylase/phosphopantothenate--cysteine ligase CoaBC [bacterium]